MPLSETLLSVPDSRTRFGEGPIAAHVVDGRRIGKIFGEPMTALKPVPSVGRQIGEALALDSPVGG